MTGIADLRSDTLTKPTDAMRAIMANADVGDDVYGEDPNVNGLEREAAELLGKDAAMFVASGTQSNLCGILAHCQRGDEYIVGQHAHTYRYEAGGAAVLGSVQPQPVEMNPDGTMDLDLLEGYIKPQPSMNHFALSKLLCLENTHDGMVLPAAYVSDAQVLGRKHELGLHLDGARMFNAAVASGVEPEEIAAGFDTVSFCLSKGLGAPVGSVLAGETGLIEEARRWRKMLGGGMRQAGILAAAGRHALEHHVKRLAEDHDRAERLAKLLADLPGLKVTSRATNMVFIEIPDVAPEHVVETAASFGVIVRGGPDYRLVTHLDIGDEHLDQVVHAFAQCVAG